jgi:hypothetical protein
MPDDLDAEIAAYEAIRPTIKRDHGSVWVLVANKRLVKTFPAFPAAARYARDHFGSRPVLIRHTDERALESAPFVQVRPQK